MSIKQSIQTAAIAGIVSLIVGGGGAYAANQITGHDIKDGSIHRADLSKHINTLLSQRPKAGAPGKAGTNGKDGKDAAAVRATFKVTGNGTIIDAHTVALSNPGTEAGSSAEALDLNLPVQATKKVVFTYRLDGRAVYGAGSPRVFIQIGDTFYNTFDADPLDAGVDNHDGTFTKTWTIPVNGTAHNVGIVVDSGIGMVTVTNLSISGEDISFN